METTVDNRIVFVPNRAGHDFSDAWRFGDLVFCTDGLLNRKDIASMQSELSKAMQHSEPDDYILLTSLTSLCTIACSIFARKHGRLNLLLYEDGQYLERTITFS